MKSASYLSHWDQPNVNVCKVLTHNHTGIQAPSPVWGRPWASASSDSRNQGPQGSVLPAGTRQHPLASAPRVRIPRCYCPYRLARPHCHLCCGPSGMQGTAVSWSVSLPSRWKAPHMHPDLSHPLQPLCSDDPPLRASFPQPANQGPPSCPGWAAKPSGSKLKTCIPPYGIPALRASGPPACRLLGDARLSGWKPPYLFSWLYHSQSVVLPSGSSPVLLLPGNTLCLHSDCLCWPSPVFVGFCNSLLLLSASCSWFLPGVLHICCQNVFLSLITALWRLCLKVTQRVNSSRLLPLEANWSRNWLGRAQMNKCWLRGK